MATTEEYRSLLEEDLRSLGVKRTPVRTQRWSPEWRVVAACAVGVVAVLSGFPPLNNVPAVLHVAALPGFALATPAAVVALLALASSRDAASTPSPLVLTPIGLTCLGAVLSLLHSRHPAASTALVLLGVIAPSALFLAVRRGGLPSPVLAASFLVALTAVLLRADLVFLQQHGLPTPTTLFQAKFSDRPYDFHYYTLGNPDETATFLLLPFTLCLVWALGRQTPKRMRRLLIGAALLIFVTLVLLYIRLPLLIATVLLLGAVMRSGWRRRVRLALAIGILSVAAAFALASPSHYLSDLFSTQSSSSGTQRLSSIGDGWQALIDHPLTGVGLGQFGSGTVPPAHSSVIQAGAEMGVAGLVGLTLITIGLPLAALKRAHEAAASTLSRAALAGAAVYVLASAMTGAAHEALLVNDISVYGLELALFAGIGLAPVAEWAPMSVRDALVGAGRVVRKRLGRGLRLLLGSGWPAYSFLWLAAAAWLINRTVSRSVPLTSSRQYALHQVLTAAQHGFGPLVQMSGPGSFAPAGLTDDQGAYLVVPWLSKIFHTANPASIVRTAFVICLAATVAGYPVVIRRLTDSALAAFASPFLVILALRVVNDGGGFYWVPAVTTALCLPWLLLFARDRSASIPSMMLIAAIAGISQIFRAGSGLGIVAASVVVSLLASQTWRRRALLLAVVAAAYLALGSGVLGLAYQARADRMHSYPLSTGGEAGVTKWSSGAGHPFWHTAYIGLGVVHNRYGIRYADSVAAAYVRSVDPTAAYVSPRYEAILRRRVLHILTTDPGFVARAETRKLEEVLADAVSRLPLLLIVVPLCIILAKGKDRRRRYSSVLVPVGLVAIAPPLLAVPGASYEMTWLGFLATIVVLCTCWLITRSAVRIRAASCDSNWQAALEPLVRVADEVERRWIDVKLRIDETWRAAVSCLSGRLRKLVQPARACVFAISSIGSAIWCLVSSRAAVLTLRKVARARITYLVLALVLASFLTRHYVSLWRTQQGGSPALLVAGVLPFNAKLPSPVEQWRFESLPRGWRAGSPGVQLRSDVTVLRGRKVIALSVRTTKTNNAYQLVAPIVWLPAGRYVAAVRGEVTAGGLWLGVLDAEADRWIAESPFGNNARIVPSTMPVTFTLASWRPIRMILSNLSTSSRRSGWLIWQAVIAPVSARVLPFDAKLPAPVEQWRFESLPRGWQTGVPGVQLRAGTMMLGGRTVAALRVSTTEKSNAYQVMSPVIWLPPGRYTATVRGELTRGGMWLGVLNVSADRWIAESPFVTQAKLSPKSMPVTFTIASRRAVRLVLSNFAPTNHRSTWVIRQVLLTQALATSGTQPSSTQMEAASGSLWRARG